MPFSSMRSLVLKVPIWFLLIPILWCNSCVLQDDPPTFMQIEHIYVQSAAAKEHFELFTEVLGLPVVWDYTNWGNFTSGGFSLGNVVLEYIDARHSETPFPYGVALKPAQPLRSVMRTLDTMGIDHGPVRKAANWSLLDLNEVLPGSVNLFVCDYHDWSHVEQERGLATDQLNASDGGGLGVQEVVYLTMGTAAVNHFDAAMTKLDGLVKTNGIYQFSKGPGIQMQSSGQPRLGLMVRVSSLDQVKVKLDELEIQHALSDQSLEITDPKFELKWVFTASES